MFDDYDPNPEGDYSNAVVLNRGWTDDRWHLITTQRDADNPFHASFRAVPIDSATGVLLEDESLVKDGDIDELRGFVGWHEGEVAWSGPLAEENARFGLQGVNLYGIRHIICFGDMMGQSLTDLMKIYRRDGEELVEIPRAPITIPFELQRDQREDYCKRTKAEIHERLAKESA